MCLRSRAHVSLGQCLFDKIKREIYSIFSFSNNGNMVQINGVKLSFTIVLLYYVVYIYVLLYHCLKRYRYRCMFEK